MCCELPQYFYYPCGGWDTLFPPHCLITQMNAKSILSLLPPVLNPVHNGIQAQEVCHQIGFFMNVMAHVQMSRIFASVALAS